MVSLLPFATAWVAGTRLASSSVVFYAGLFVCVDLAYNVFEHHVLARADATQVSARMRGMASRRSRIVLASFTTAMLVALVAPRLGFGLMWRSDPSLAPGRSGQSSVIEKSGQTSQIDDDIANRL
jgi:uncharacterized membrane protein